MKILEHVDMSKYTSFRAGGTARRMAVCESVPELAELLEEMEKSGERYVFLGNGSNTIFADGEYNGTVVTQGDSFAGIEAGAAGRLAAGAAALLSRLARAAAANSRTGLEFAAGIPGSVGGAVFMNAGAYGGEIKDVLHSVTLLRRNPEGKYIETRVPAEELELSYRKSRLQETGEMICSAEFDLPEGKREDIEALMLDLAKRRSDKQPLEFPSAGSFFKRPEGYFAGKLIEDAGLKGMSVGGAKISEKHAGFMINTGGATAEDIVSLMHLVQQRVKEEFGIDLEPEVRIIGN